MAYNLFRNSVLPNSGGWLDQSYKYSTIMIFMDSEVKAHQKENNGKK